MTRVRAYISVVMGRFMASLYILGFLGGGLLVGLFQHTNFVLFMAYDNFVSLFSLDKY